ncbi:hypothetical protein B1J93_18525 [Leptospira kirschneri serovar Pomona]|uniref:Uncharacterized protein n=1 Tax=Leptospira kirschneri serovar Pomona TaxID=561005 RepID=A0A1T1DHJ8_9LEPT|nr:hypothetical protein B1J93_18525 [Leptospira kirschneri serovar Pomona]
MAPVNKFHKRNLIQYLVFYLRERSAKVPSYRFRVQRVETKPFLFLVSKMWELSQIVDLPVVPHLNTTSYKLLFFKLW